MRFRLLTLLFIVISSMGYSQRQTVLPTSDFTTNFCKFPFAWENQPDKKISIAIIDNEGNTALLSKVKFVKQYVPCSEVSTFSTSDILNNQFKVQSFDVLIVADEIKEEEYDSFIKMASSSKKLSCVLSAYYGPMDSERDYTKWQFFVKRASDAGCIISGSHGDMYQLGDLSYWNKVPVDIFTVMGRDIDGFQPMMPDYKIKHNLEKTVYTTSSAVALIKSYYPKLDNSELKHLLKERGRIVYWSHILIPEGKDGIQIMVPHFDKDYLGRYDDERVKILQRSVFKASTLDLASILGITEKMYGEWCADALNVAEINKISTGKGVTVAILDHSFNKNSAALKGRVVSPVSFVEGEEPLVEKSDHGTFMAEDLVMIAPDVKIMPIVMTNGNMTGYSESFVKAINYAVENGANVISCSQPAVKDNQIALDEAIQNAIDRGVSVVYINYTGDNNSVIMPGVVEFEKYSNSKEKINIIGTNFISKETPVTWGISHAAPVISGVIALIKEKNPQLTPQNIKSILLNQTNNSPAGLLQLNKEVFEGLQSN
mgnify:FL=1